MTNVTGTSTNMPVKTDDRGAFGSDFDAKAHLPNCKLDVKKFSRDI